MENLLQSQYIAPEARGVAADVYNSALASWAIAAAWEIGVLDELVETGKLDAEEYATRNGFDQKALMGMFAALAAVRMVERHGSVVLTGPNFEKLNESRSLFHWLSRGSGELFRQMPFVMRTRNRHGAFFERDAAAISFACKEANDRFFAPTFWEAMAGLDFGFTVVADLGSGSGDRLAQIVQRYPGTRGVGIDIAPAAIEFARTAIAEAGLSDRISFVADDIRFATPRPAYQDVELLTCFMMGHDFWPREQCVTSLRRLRDAFPKARRLLLGDTARTTGVPDDDYPVFSLGFEVGHDLMGVYLPTIEEWENVFEEGGWRLAGKRLFHLPSAGFVFELDRLG